MRANLVMSGAAAGKLRHLVRAAPQVLRKGHLPQTFITSDATDMTDNPHLGHQSSPECVKCSHTAVARLSAIPFIAGCTFQWLLQLCALMMAVQWR